MPGFRIICERCGRYSENCECLDEHNSLEGMAVAAASVVLFCGLVLFAIVSSVAY